MTMCDHDFVSIKAGTFYCESCGLFLPALPEQMAKSKEETLSNAVDKTVNDVLKGQLIHVIAQHLNAPSTFEKFAKPLIRALYPKKVADSIFTKVDAS